MRLIIPMYFRSQSLTNLLSKLYDGRHFDYLAAAKLNIFYAAPMCFRKIAKIYMDYFD